MTRSEALARLDKMQRSHARMAPNLSHQFYEEYARTAEALRMAREALESRPLAVFARRCEAFALRLRDAAAPLGRRVAR